MRVYLKELKFPSTVSTYLKDITPDIISIIKQAKVKEGMCIVNSKHTTLGIIVNELLEPNLLDDILDHTKSHVHEDERSTWVEKGDYTHPIGKFKHRCMDSPLRDPEEIDDDYNAGRHIRTLMYSHQSVAVPIRDGKLELGKYQQVGVFEFDGRDGQGKNPIRQRTVQLWIYPAEEIVEL